MNDTTPSEKKFWNDDKIVEYFESKPADPKIVNKLSQVKNASELSALDLGCGGGRHTEMLCNMGFETYACDINPAMIAATKKRVQNYIPTNEMEKRIKEGTILHIPFNDNFFDVVVTTGVLHQAATLDQYESALKELSRVTKTGAIVCLNIFTNKELDPTYEAVAGEEYSYVTKEGLPMTLLPQELFYKMMAQNNFTLEEELSEDVKQENTGVRVVLRCNFIKST